MCSQGKKWMSHVFFLVFHIICWIWLACTWLPECLICLNYLPPDDFHYPKIPEHFYFGHLMAGNMLCRSRWAVCFGNGTGSGIARIACMLDKVNNGLWWWVTSKLEFLFHWWLHSGFSCPPDHFLEHSFLLLSRNMTWVIRNNACAVATSGGPAAIRHVNWSTEAGHVDHM